MTNSKEIANELSVRCSNRQSHGVRRQCEFGRTCRGPRTAGPMKYPVVRRVILDVGNMVALQDPRNVQSATNEEWKFKLPKRCREIQTNLLLREAWENLA